MSPLSVINKAPGVYIEEVQLPGTIPGVGTSTAAFIGPAQMGPINKPTFLTNWTQFQDTFGGYITDPMRIYVTHAVRGFFDNGGTACYFVRVGTGKRASLTLKDKGGTPRPTLVVTAKREGTDGNAIKVEVDDASIVASVAAVQVEAKLSSASGNQATVAGANETEAANNAKKFRLGDIVLIEKDANNERAAIASINGATITFQAKLTHSYTDNTNIRIADLIRGQRKLRLASTEGIEPGTNITIEQKKSTAAGEVTITESGVVQLVERANHFITLEKGLANVYAMTGAPVNLKTLEFKLIVRTPDAVEEFNNLSMDPRHSRYFANPKVVESSSVDVVLADPPSPTLPPNNRPTKLDATNLIDGAEENLAAIQTLHYSDAVAKLEKIDEVNVLCIPDSVNPDGIGKNLMQVQEVQAAMIAHCEKMQDRFAILDPQANATPSDGIVTQRGTLVSVAGYAALYYPWIVIANPTASGRIIVPPSGHIAGVYARVDSLRGVHKAPANEPIRGALAVEQILTDEEQGPLNEKGVNVIRSFPGRGVIVWGARTIAPQDRTQWRYVNVRRLLLFVEESIQEGTQFAVFEPNDLELWQKVKRQVTEFLTRVWRDGALFGATPEEAFRVRVDEDLNPPGIRALGQLIIEVILFPTTPAEFVVFRIIQKPGGGTFEEI